MEAHSWDVVVVGGGAAGLSAALMLGRARRHVLVLDAGGPRNRFAAHMHGVLGHDGLDPARLLATGRDEVASYGVKFDGGTVARIDETDGGVDVTLADGVVHRARAVIVATGLSDDLPDIPGLAQRWGRSVLHCPYCHGWEVRDQRLGVLATSPLAVHQAELVRQWSDRITLFSAGVGTLEPAVERRLRARGINVVPTPVVEVLGDGDRITGVRTESGEIVPVDAIFTAATLRPHDGFLAHLALDRADSPVGSFLAVDATGKTSGDRIWAAGNVANPMANVPMSMSAGAMAGAMVNMALVTAEFDAAEAAAAGNAEPTLAGFWESRYADNGRVWSGRPNAALVAVAEGLPAGRALDLGCGEGGDAIWLARQGWQVTGVDISPTALDRAAKAAAEAGIAEGRTRWLTQDLATLSSEGQYDLVTAAFLHSPIDIPRADILRRAANLVAPGGHLLIVSHSGFPPWSAAHDHGEHRFLTPAEEVDALALDPHEWEVRIAETRSRDAIGPDGQQAVLDDAVVLLRRR